MTGMNFGGAVPTFSAKLGLECLCGWHFLTETGLLLFKD